MVFPKWPEEHNFKDLTETSVNRSFLNQTKKIYDDTLLQNFIDLAYNDRRIQPVTPGNRAGKACSRSLDPYLKI